MATPKTIRPLQYVQLQLPFDPTPAPQQLPYFSEPAGLSTRRQLDQYGQQLCPSMNNFILDNGQLRSRGAMRIFGTQCSGTQMLVVNFIQSDGSSYVIRFDTDKIYKYGSGAWVQITGAGPFTGTASNPWTVTAWNNKLLASNGVDQLVYIDPAAGTMAAVGAAPAGILHLTTFAGRVIATLVDKIQWSVKNDYSDWTGLGSGFESLLSTPGGVVDTIYGVYPIADESALVVRSGSIWQVVTTGQFDAPFRFSRYYGGVGSKARSGIAAVPRGVMFPSQDNSVVIVQLDGIQDVGREIYENLDGTRVDFSSAFSIYNSLRQEYVMAVDEDADGTLDAVYKFSLLEKGWTREKYAFNIRSLGYTKYQMSATVDSLVGTVDSLTDPVDSLGFQQAGVGFFVVSSAASKYIMLQDPLSTLESDDSGVAVSVDLSLTSGLLNYDGIGFRALMNEIAAAFVVGETQTLIIEYSSDSGTTWNNYSSLSVSPKVTPQQVKFTKTVDAPLLQFRLRSTTLGKLRVSSITPKVERGALINP